MIIVYDLLAMVFHFLSKESCFEHDFKTFDKNKVRWLKLKQMSKSFSSGKVG